MNVRDAHLAHVASIPEADLTSPLVGEQDTVKNWPIGMAMWAGFARFIPPPDADDDGDVLP